MIILDTDVMSELLKPRPDLRVVEWVWRLPTGVATTVFNRVELLAGIHLMPPGRRRDSLSGGLGEVLSQLGVCLPFTPECADRYGSIVSARMRAGRPLGTMDALIAAVALEAGATLATRDVKDFTGLGLELVNPWNAT